MIVWPEDLPVIVTQDGFSLGMRDGRVTTQTDGGPGKMRRRFSSAFQSVAAATVLKIDVVPRFERFWDIDTQGGSRPFLYPDTIRHHRPLAAPGGTVLMAGDVPLLTERWWVCRFARGEAPSVVPTGPFTFRASFGLEVLP